MKKLQTQPNQIGTYIAIYSFKKTLYTQSNNNYGLKKNIYIFGHSDTYN